MSDLRHSSGAEGGEASPGDKLQAKLGEGSEDGPGRLSGVPQGRNSL